MTTYDGRDGSSTDITPMLTSMGTATTGQEVNEAGVYVWDTASTVEEKLRAHRETKVLPKPSANSEPNVVDWVVTLILSVIVGAFAYSKLNDFMFERFAPAVPETSFAAFERETSRMSPVALKAERESSLEKFTQTLAHLYKPGTNFETIFSKCSVKFCGEPDYQAIQAFKKFALSPAVYESDVCKSLIPGYLHKKVVSQLRQRDWKLSEDADSKGKYRCVDADPDSVMTQYRHDKNSAKALVSLVSGLLVFAIFGVLFFLVIRRNRKRHHKS